MKNLSLIILICSIILTSSCQNNDEDVAGVLKDTSVNISVISKAGEDLLNPNNSNHFDKNGIKLYDVENGKVTEVNNPNMDAPNGFLLFERDSSYWLTIFPNTANPDKHLIMHIQWKESDIDTLKYEVTRKNNNTYIVISKVWFNEALVWDGLTDSDNRHFEIVK